VRARVVGHRFRATEELTMDEETRARFEAAVERKGEDVFSVRDKNSGKGKKTADKWNQ
jgi:hypothetical protein